MSYTGGSGRVGGRAPCGEGPGRARAVPGSTAPPPEPGHCPLLRSQNGAAGWLLRFVPLKPWRLGSLCWHSCVLAPSRWRCWLLSPFSAGPGLGARGLSFHSPLQLGLLGPRRLRWPFLRSRLFQSVSGLGCRRHCCPLPRAVSLQDAAASPALCLSRAGRDARHRGEESIFGGFGLSGVPWAMRG